MTRKEAIKNIKKWDFLNEQELEALQTVIPELKESEDERIKKSLINELKINASLRHEINRCGWDPDKLVAWLENQEFLEWNDEYREEDLLTRFAFYTYKNEPGVLYLSNLFVEEANRNKGLGTKILNAAEDVAEDIGADKIRLMVKYDSPVKIWYHKHGYVHFAHVGKYDWLEKSLNTEPNEEFIPIEDTLEYKFGFKAGQKYMKPFILDKEQLQNAIDALEFLGNKGVYASNSGYDAAINAAKSLKKLL